MTKFPRTARANPSRENVVAEIVRFWPVRPWQPKSHDFGCARRVAIRRELIPGERLRLAGCPRRPAEDFGGFVGTPKPAPETGALPENQRPSNGGLIRETQPFKKLEKLGDAIIAATALTHRLPLVTRNTSDFAGIPNRRHIDPLAD